MFEPTVLALIQGAFICDQTNANAYQWLRDDNNQKSVDDFLRKIGRKLVATNNGNAFYAAWQTVGQNERTEIKNTFASIKHTIAPVVSFLEMCMKYTKEDAAPTSGERVNYSDMLVAISDNANALEMLHSFTNMGKEFVSSDASPKGMLDKVIQQMIKWGYLVENSKKMNTYIFTGKLDYFYEILTFLNENEMPGSLGDEDESQASMQEALL